MRPPKNPQTAERLSKYYAPETKYTAAQWLKDKNGMPFAQLPVLEGQVFDVSLTMD